MKINYKMDVTVKKGDNILNNKDYEISPENIWFILKKDDKKQVLLSAEFENGIADSEESDFMFIENGETVLLDEYTFLNKLDDYFLDELSLGVSSSYYDDPDFKVEMKKFTIIFEGKYINKTFETNNFYLARN